ALFSIINVFTYPLQPSQISLISAFNIGIPSFFLALEANEGKQKGRFLTQTLLRALPASLTSFLSIAALVLFAGMFDLPDSEIGTASTYLLAVVGFIILIQLSKPLNRYRTIIIVGCMVGFIVCLTWFDSLFSIEALSLESASLCTVFALAEITVIKALTELMNKGRSFAEHRNGGEDGNGSLGNGRLTAEGDRTASTTLFDNLEKLGLTEKKKTRKRK
ncbi:MAG TPA: hypothetical protein PLS28_03205, partial [Clostridiales bacterium]|nr:hypothetical protein [Clostridiales bacterium]